VIQRISCLLLILLLVASALPVLAADHGETAYTQARRQYLRLLQSEAKQKHRDNWERVIHAFEQVAHDYPRHRREVDALYMAGRCWEGLYENSHNAADARRAIAAYDRLVERYPDSRLADDGLFFGGELARQLADFPGAYLRFTRVVEDYPKGDMLARARNGLELLDRVPAAAAAAPAVGMNAAPSAAHPSNPAPAPAAATGEGRLEGIRFWSNPNYTRVVLDLDHKVHYHSQVLGSGSDAATTRRLFIDLEATDPAPEVGPSLDVKDGLLSRIRTGRSADGTTRVVLDLTSLGDFTVFELSKPQRIVIDVRGEEPGAAAPAAPTGGDTIGGLLKKAPAEAPLPSVANRKHRGPLCIVVDAGHGGKDPGAIGPDGVLEKNVTLAMAKELARELPKMVPCKVILTRDHDIFIPLEERTALANKARADLFISLHANASPSHAAYGTETFFLNLAKNDRAAELAARENGTSLEDVGALEAILFDLMAHAKINESSRLASDIQRHLVSSLSNHYSHVRNLGVKQGPFYVLLGATMPSVLVESAFISHPREEKRLNSSRFRSRSAAAIAAGVKAYVDSMKLLVQR